MLHCLSSEALDWSAGRIARALSRVGPRFFRVIWVERSVDGLNPDREQGPRRWMDGGW